MAGNAWQVAPPQPTLSLVPSTVAGFVQAALNQSGSASALATFANPITAGNSVIAAFQTGGTTPSVSPSSGPDTYTVDANAGTGLLGTAPNLFYAHVSNSAGGYTGVTVSGGAGGFSVLGIYEVSGPITFDTTAHNTGTTGNFNVSYTPAHAGEFLVGMAIDSLGSASLGTPTSGGGRWTLEGTTTDMVQSYQGTVGTSAVSYANSLPGSGNTASAVGGYVLTNSGIPATPTTGCILFYVNEQLWALGETGVPALLATT